MIWMKIAKAEISEDPSVTGDLLNLSDGLLTVADVLQFFPEFATIDHFKQGKGLFLFALKFKLKGVGVANLSLFQSHFPSN